MDTLAGQIGAVVWIGLGALAIWRGGVYERLAAGCSLVGWLAYLVVHVDDSGLVPASPDWPGAVVDMVVLAFLFGIAVRANRGLLTLAAGFDAIVVLIHVVVLIDPRILNISYVAAQALASYGVQISITLSALRTAAPKPVEREAPKGSA